MFVASPRMFVLTSIDTSHFEFVSYGCRLIRHSTPRHSHTYGVGIAVDLENIKKSCKLKAYEIFYQKNLKEM